MYVLVALVLVCVDVLVTSSAYEVTCIDACDCDMLDVHVQVEYYG